MCQEFKNTAGSGQEVHEVQMVKQGYHEPLEHIHLFAGIT